MLPPACSCSPTSAPPRRRRLHAAEQLDCAGQQRAGLTTLAVRRTFSRQMANAVNDGLGFRILEAREFMWSDKIIAGMITIGLLGLAIDTAVSRLNNHLLRWHRGLEH